MSYTIEKKKDQGVLNDIGWAKMETIDESGIRTGSAFFVHDHLVKAYSIGSKGGFNAAFSRKIIKSF